MTDFERKLSQIVALKKESARCLSVVTDCKTICDRCKEAQAKYARESITNEVNKAISILESWGFTVKEN